MAKVPKVIIRPKDDRWNVVRTARKLNRPARISGLSKSTPALHHRTFEAFHEPFPRTPARYWLAVVPFDRSVPLSPAAQRPAHFEHRDADLVHAKELFDKEQYTAARQELNRWWLPHPRRARPSRVEAEFLTAPVPSASSTTMRPTGCWPSSMRTWRTSTPTVRLSCSGTTSPESAGTTVRLGGTGWIFARTPRTGGVPLQEGLRAVPAETSRPGPGRVRQGEGRHRHLRRTGHLLRRTSPTSGHQSTALSGFGELRDDPNFEGSPSAIAGSFSAGEVRRAEGSGNPLLTRPAAPDASMRSTACGRGALPFRRA